MKNTKLLIAAIAAGAMVFGVVIGMIASVTRGGMTLNIAIGNNCSAKSVLPPMPQHCKKKHRGPKKEEILASVRGIKEND